MDESLKEQKQAFVSGHKGTTVAEIQLVNCVAPVSYLLWKALNYHEYSRGQLVRGPRWIGDFAVLVFPSILAQTRPEWVLHLLALMLGISIVLMLLSPRKVPPKKSSNAGHHQYLLDPIRPYLVTYRSFGMLLTCISILAVDFHAYPRRFAKCETFGTSLMDVGVGSVLVTGGIVAGARLGKDKTLETLKDKLRGLYKSVRIALPVLILGLARLISVKSVNYQEHVSEYGIHWNFFFTLGCIPVIVSLVHLLPFKIHYGLAGIVMATLYQFLLSYAGFQDWVLNASRDNLVSMNKEGLGSLFGYASLFLVAAQLGSHILSTKTSPYKLPKTLLFISVLFAASLQIITSQTFADVMHLKEPLLVSRRLANLPYVLWVLAMNVFLLLLLQLVELLPLHIPSRDSKANSQENLPSICRAVNKNQLFVFLVANVSTGVVNLSINTLTVPDVAAIGIITLYMFFVSAVAIGVDMKGWRIKL